MSRQRLRLGHPCIAYSKLNLPMDVKPGLAQLWNGGDRGDSRQLTRLIKEFFHYILKTISNIIIITKAKVD